MLEKPDIAEGLLISRVQDQYGLRAASLTFLPLGADVDTAVYRLVADDGNAFFLKLRRVFEEISVTVPLYLRSQGIQEIIAPLATRSHRGWVDFGEYKLILYPFIGGKNGFQMELSDSHRRTFGAALNAIHSVQIPPELTSRIPQETFSPQGRERVRELQRMVENTVFHDLNAARLANFIRCRRRDIDRLIARTEKIASDLQSQALDLVLCHTDIHGGNILIAEKDEFYIVDWDAPLLAPKERDLMFIGGGVDDLWKNQRDEAVFYEGYGKAEIDPAMMAYYRHERVIEDLAAYGGQLLLTDEGGADREEAYTRFTGNFEPGHTIDIAGITDPSAP